MKTIKTTIIVPETIWFQFQKLTGPKKTSRVLSKLLRKMIMRHNAEKLINTRADATWNDSYLYKTLEEELKRTKDLSQLP